MPPEERPPQAKARIGLFGGTFNPVHNGHLFLALEALHQSRLDRVEFIPNRLPPHKEAPSATAEVRFRMLSAAVEGVPQFTVSRRELDRDGPSFTVDTLASYPPDVELAFICGQDAFRAPWYRLEEVMERLDTLLIASRAGFHSEMPPQLADLPNHLQGKIRRLEFPPIALSSSALRERVRSGRPVRFLIPEPVFRIITESRLYLETETQHPNSNTIE